MAQSKAILFFLILELEVHDIVTIRTQTKEDKWAIKLLNSYCQLSTIKDGAMEREINVFGDPFNTGVLVTGIIDQVEYNKETMELFITDYKTRKTPTLPQSAQNRGHDFQLMMYKLLLDGLTRATTDIFVLSESLGLDLSRSLTVYVMDYIEDIGLIHLINYSASGSLKFGEVASTLCSLIAGLDLPPVSKLTVQYEYQADRTVIGTRVVDFNRDWTKVALEKEEKFWTGENLPSGPDIEDLWKCKSCQFRDVCVWTKQKMLERSPASKTPQKTTKKCDA